MERESDIPKLPKGPLFRPSGAQLFRIGSVAILLFAVVALRKPCGQGVAQFIGQFDEPVDAGAPQPNMVLERLTEEDIAKRFRPAAEVELREASPTGQADKATPSADASKAEATSPQPPPRK